MGFNMKSIYLIRHGKSSLEGTERERGLVEEGLHQAEQLVNILGQLVPKVEGLYSSPYRRAFLMLEPYASKNDLYIHHIENLREREISNMPVKNLNEERKKMWKDMDYKLPGGESGNTAQERAIKALNSILDKMRERAVAIVSHGNLIGIILKYYKPDFGFTEWRNMTMPDIFRLDYIDEQVKIIHIGCTRIDTFKIG